MEDNYQKLLLTTLQSKVKEVGNDEVLAMLSEMSHKKVNKQTFLNKLSPTYDTHNVTLKEFLFIMKILEQDSNGFHVHVIEDLLTTFGLKCDRYYPDPNINISYRTLLNSMMSSDKEHGDVSQVIHESLEDNKISDLEIQKIKHEINEEIDALIKLRSLLIHANKNSIIIK